MSVKMNQTKTFSFGFVTFLLIISVGCIHSTIERESHENEKKATIQESEVVGKNLMQGYSFTYPIQAIDFEPSPERGIVRIDPDDGLKLFDFDSHQFVDAGISTPLKFVDDINPQGDLVYFVDISGSGMFEVLSPTSGRKGFHQNDENLTMSSCKNIDWNSFESVIIDSIKTDLGTYFCVLTDKNNLVLGHIIEISSEWPSWVRIEYELDEHTIP